MKPAPLLLAGILAGCATPSDLMQQPAVLESDSIYSVQELTACIGEKWSKLGGYIVSNVPVKNGQMLSLMGGDGNADATVTVSKRDEGSHIRYGERRFVIGFNDQTVKGCLNNPH